MIGTFKYPNYLINYAKFSSKCDAHYIISKYKYEPATVLAMSKIDPLPYQLEDFLDLLMEMDSEEHMHALLSYETGLGKTIVAGLVIKELLLNQPDANIIVIATPMGVQQWKEELEQKFGITGVKIESMDTLKMRLDQLKREEPSWDLAVVDELHRATPGNKRYELISWVRDHSKNFLGLTATPHDGKHEHFIGRLQLINRAVDESNYKSFLEKHNYRRLKREVEGLNGEKLFPFDVLSELVPSSVTREERMFYDAVENYVREQYNKAFRTKNSRYGLLATVMGRLASSSIKAGIAAMKRRKERLISATAMAVNHQELLERLRDYFNGVSDEEFDQIAEDVLQSVEPESREDLREELNAIEEIIRFGEEIESKGIDSKYEKLKEVIDKHVRKGDKIVVFTSFVETAEYLHEKMPYSQIVTGKMMPDERRENIKKFLESGKVLVGTEVIGESLNLQKANVVINYELPWSPIVFIQRVGRVYRYPMTKPIFIYSFNSELRVERRVLQVLYEKVNRLVSEFDEGSVAIIGNEISEDEIEKIIQEAYVKGEEISIKLLKEKAQESLKHAEELKKVLEISEAGKMHINASAILRNVSQLVTPEDLKSFLYKMNVAGLGDGDPYQEPPFFRINNITLKKLDINDPCVKEALKEATELPPQKISLLSDKDGEAVVHEVEYVDNEGQVIAVDVVVSDYLETVPYNKIKGLDAVDIEPGEINVKVPLDLQDRLKNRKEEVYNDFKEKIIKQAELINSYINSLKDADPIFLRERKKSLSEKRDKLKLKILSGISVRPGKVLGYVRFVSNKTAYKALKDEKYDENFIKRKKLVENAAMRYVIDYESKRGYEVNDIHEQDLGYDIISKKGPEEKFIEIKGITEGDTITLTRNEFVASQYFKEKYYLYIVKDPINNPELVIKRPPFSIKEVQYVEQYVISI